MTFKNLDELFKAMKQDHRRDEGEGDPRLGDWTDLPVFGGLEIENTIGVWSWDANRKIVGTCASDIQIVNR